jgi:prolyl 4-hydroxylase
MKQEIETAPVDEMVDLEAVLTNTRPPTNKDRHDRIRIALEKKDKYKGIYGFFVADPNDGVPARARSPGDVLVEGNVVLVMEGGQWLWPGIAIGFERAVNFRPYKALDSDPELNLTIVTKSLNPLVVEVSQFLTSEQAKYVIERTEPHMKKSPVSHMDHDVGKPDTNWRTSSQHFLPSDTPMLQLMDRQVAALANIKRNHQEHFQVLRYEKGERYVAHHDYFDPRMYAKNEGIQSMTKRGLFNRMATVFFYLSDVEAGGATNFPRAGGLPQPSDFGDCTKGVSVTPKQGRIIIFYSLKPNGAGDELSLHGGCAVESGTKWSANKWIWNKPMDYTRD